MSAVAPWSTPPAGNGVQKQDGNWSAAYDALNRPTVSIASVIQWYGYDPLGRQTQTEGRAHRKGQTF